MKLWLLDADVIIDLLSAGIFDDLVERHEVYTATIVIGEVKSFYSSGEKKLINFRTLYVDNGKVKELTANAGEINDILLKIPSLWRGALHAGELESLAILSREEDLIFCSCDALPIRTLPFLDASEKGISIEKLIKISGLKRIELEAKHTEEYFQNNLSIGKVRMVENFKS
ncbi:hypothetical protein BMS3Bbin08_01404 [bacterium BMS3Bbin08]|nr:hypothetical protein BMS3Bbin08_01404 [bacterium BMS3Bbin08]HDH49974.1 hypothetical protein [Nitrospirota bacterium]